MWGRLRQARDWPVAGSAVRRVAQVEEKALTELKRRLDKLENAAGAETEAASPATAVEQLAALLEETRSVDQDVAREACYRQTLAAMVPDQVAMLEVLARRGHTVLAHLGARRLPWGKPRFILLSNISNLGQEAGVLLPEHTCHYISRLFALGLLQTGPRDKALDTEYELLMADTQLRQVRDYIRRTLKMRPCLQEATVGLSNYGQALWRDCRAAAETLQKLDLQL